MQYLTEAFQELESLTEEAFSFDKEGAEELKKLREDDFEDDLEVIIDPEAETDEEAEDNSHIGDVVMVCDVCKSEIFKKPEDIHVDEETHEVNVSEECPYCQSAGGYKIIGQISEYHPEEEIEVEEDEEIDESLEDLHERYYYIDDELSEKDAFFTSLKDEAPSEFEDNKKKLKAQGSVRVDGVLYQIADKAKKGTQFHEAKQNYAKSCGSVIQSNFAKLNKASSKEEVIDLITKAFDKENVPKDYAAQVLTNLKSKSFERGVQYLGDIVLAGMGLKVLKESYLRENATPDLVIGESDYELDMRTGDVYIDTSIFDAFEQDGYVNIQFIDEEDEPINTYKMVEMTVNSLGDEATRFEFISPTDEFLGENCSKNNLQEKKEEDLWTKIYHELTTDGTMIKKGKNLQTNRGAGYDFQKQVTTDKDGNIVVRGKEERDLKAAIDVADKYSKKGVKYNIAKGDYGKGYQYGLTIEIPEDLKESRIIEAPDLGKELEKYQNWVDYDMKRYGKISGKTKQELNKAGVEVIKDDHGDYEVIAKDKKALGESFEEVEVKTDREKIKVEQEGDETKVSVKPRDDSSAEIEEESEEIITPVSDETKMNIALDNLPEEDISVEEFSEEDFDELGESYLKEVYDNVAAYKTLKGSVKGNKMYLEGIITFNSGKKVKTNFIFESMYKTKRGKLKLIGENMQITPKKKAFTITGKMKGNKLVTESFTYNYLGKDAKTGRGKALYGTIKHK